ncbi:hypothetical protein NP233_g2714 [Leucocoprinus birnbaumii]|uniref:Uncharacterized protein n=1 Tax=Leucocoprinus birnbaumii TaxID=56174 RepID=A0AAD5VYE6_9AGAR|nr:hypothetical protein NP233_g2714 [Leucocoprinus birnbaumii]
MVAFLNRNEVTEDYCVFPEQKTFKVYTWPPTRERWIEEDERTWVKGSIVVLWTRIVGLARQKGRVARLPGALQTLSRGKHISKGRKEGTEHATIRLFDRFYQCFGAIHVACGMPSEIAIFDSETRRFEGKPLRDQCKVELTVNLDGPRVCNGCYDVLYEVELGGGWTAPMRRLLTPRDITEGDETWMEGHSGRKRLIGFQMPEAFVVSFVTKEANKYADMKGETSGLPPEHVDEHGLLIIHQECCARTNGNRQSVSVHTCPENDPIRNPLPVPKNGKGQTCLSCYISDSPGANRDLEHLALSIKDSHSHLHGKLPSTIVNELKIKGRMYAISRGKEFVMIINEYAIRICFGLEGHCFWVPTAVYRDITALPPVARGEKSKAFQIPSEHWGGPSNVPALVSIQAAFVRPDWTFIICDHNVMIWPYLWSITHGPVSYLEPLAFRECLNAWRQHQRESLSDTPIWLEIKGNQQVFNGYGAQETCDMLFWAFIHPLMPSSKICLDETLWSRFIDNVISYQQRRIELVNQKNSKFPSISGKRPFQWHANGHRLFLAEVPVFRKARVRVTRVFFEEMQRYGLHNPDATIMDNGFAEVVPRNPMYDPNTLPVMPTGLDWWPLLKEFSVNQDDIMKIHNSTTVGPYSFQVFVSALSWTATKVKSIGIPVGRRPREKVNRGVRKRPLKSDISKTAPKPKRSRINLLAEEGYNDFGMDNQELHQEANSLVVRQRRNPKRSARSIYSG